MCVSCMEGFLASSIMRKEFQVISAAAATEKDAREAQQGIKLEMSN